MKDVYLYSDNTISFEYKENECICIGETDETLESFLEFMKKDRENRNIVSNLPTVR